MLELLLSCMMLRPIATAESGLLPGLRAELRSIENPVTVIDVGTGNGEFMPKIKEVFRVMGFKNIRVIGIDDFSFLRWSMPAGYVQEKTSEEKLFKHLRDTYHEQGIEYLRGHMEDVRRWLVKGDFVFINAPYPDMVHAYILSALKMVKPDGYILLRMYYGDERPRNNLPLKAWIEDHLKMKVSELKFPLPEGNHVLSQNIFLISKAELSRELKFDGLSFEDLVMDYYGRNEIRRAA